MTTIDPKELARIAAGETFESNFFTCYWTRGNTYIIASPAKWNDDDEIHDIIAIGRRGEVTALVVTANPDLVEQISQAVTAAKSMRS